MITVKQPNPYSEMCTSFSFPRVGLWFCVSHAPNNVEGGGGEVYMKDKACYGEIYFWYYTVYLSDMEKLYCSFTVRAHQWDAGQCSDGFYLQQYWLLQLSDLLKGHSIHVHLGLKDAGWMQLTDAKECLWALLSAH